MPFLRSHLTVLQRSTEVFPDAAAFRLPRVSSSGDVHSWDVLTFNQFSEHVEQVARHWSRVLHHNGIPRKSIIGLWISGMTYSDATLIYGLSRAGYIPQLFSLRLPNPVVVQELLDKAGAKALIHDPQHYTLLQPFTLPLFSALRGHDQADDLVELPPISAPSDPHASVFVFHTSGSTSGSPKLVHCSHAWLDHCILKAEQIGRPTGSSLHEVMNWMGSMCHIAQTFMLLSSVLHGSCMIQPTAIAFSSNELVDMISRCGLNRLNKFPTFLSTHLRDARLNPKVLALLRGLDRIIYSGLALPTEDERWATANGIKLQNLFGSTELGAMLSSTPGDRLLRPLEGTAYSFVPIDAEGPSVASESGHSSVNHHLLELVILSSSGDCPERQLRHCDGHFHTGDLFQEVEPGAYITRGRNDDWIKSENSLRCDTRSIEENVYATCQDMVADCIVVGNRRPSPVLFVEPVEETVDPDALKKAIIRRTRHFHSRRYEHERLAGVASVVVVAKGTLPRTAKGNIRRTAVESQYEALLNSIFDQRP